MNTTNRVVNRTRIIVIASLATAAVAAFSVQAAAPSDATTPPPTGHSWHGHHHGPGGRFMHVLKQLNLTAEQKAQIHGIFASAKTQFGALRSSMRTNSEALIATSPRDPAYPALLATAQSNAAARIKQMSDIKAQIYEVLTPAQQAQIPQILAANKAKWQERHQGQPASPTSTPATTS